jgi:oligoendopeptidase F
MPSGTTTLPITAVRGLATDPDPVVRRAAYDAELAAWPTVATAAAAALNAIKGEANIVNRRRHWASPLDASLYANNVSRPTFDAMQSAVVASLPRFRTYLRTKATLHGHQGGLPWWDLFAPAPAASEPGPSALERAVQAIDPDALSPREALDLIYQLKKVAGQTGAGLPS